MGVAAVYNGAIQVAIATYNNQIKIPACKYCSNAYHLAFLARNSCISSLSSLRRGVDLQADLWEQQRFSSTLAGDCTASETRWLRGLVAAEDRCTVRESPTRFARSVRARVSPTEFALGGFPETTSARSLSLRLSSLSSVSVPVREATDLLQSWSVRQMPYLLPYDHRCKLTEPLCVELQDRSVAVD